MSNRINIYILFQCQGQNVLENVLDKTLHITMSYRMSLIKHYTVYQFRFLVFPYFNSRFAIRDFSKIRSICFICLLQSTVAFSADSAFRMNSSASLPSSVGMKTVTFCVGQLNLWNPTLWQTGHSFSLLIFVLV